MKLAQDELMKILRAAGYRILESEPSRAVARRGNRTVTFSEVDAMDDERFAAVLRALGMSDATLEALRDVSPPPSSRG